MRIMIMPEGYDYSVKNMQKYFKHDIKPGDIVDWKLPKFGGRIPRKLKKKVKAEGCKKGLNIVFPKDPPREFVLYNGYYGEIKPWNDQDLRDFFDTLERKTNEKINNG
jgi:hypothetical protein